MYDANRIEHLASDEAYAKAVRAFAKRLIASGLVTGDGLRELAPLTRYGPHCAAMALSLQHVPRLAELDAELAGQWVELADRVEEARC